MTHNQTLVDFIQEGKRRKRMSDGKQLGSGEDGGDKFDGDKLRTDLMSTYALEGLSQVLTHGAKSMLIEIGKKALRGIVCMGRRLDISLPSGLEVTRISNLAFSILIMQLVVFIFCSIMQGIILIKTIAPIMVAK